MEAQTIEIETGKEYRIGNDSFIYLGLEDQRHLFAKSIDSPRGKLVALSKGDLLELSEGVLKGNFRTDFIRQDVSERRYNELMGKLESVKGNSR
jgi:hypothetical protein